MGSDILHDKPDEDSCSLYYGNHLQHLSDELRLLDLKLLREVQLRKTSAAEARFAATKGFYISTEEVISLLDHTEEAHSARCQNPDIKFLDARIEEVRNGIADKLSYSETSAKSFPLLRLAQMFSLDSFEVDVLMLALAPETDKKYDRIYAYLNDDLTRKSPSVSLALDILCPDIAERVHGLRPFLPGGPLLHFGLVNVMDGRDSSSFLARGFALNERITRHILGHNGLHTCLSEIVQLHYPDGPSQDDDIQADFKEKVLFLLTNRKENWKQVFWLYGKADEEKKANVISLCQNVGFPLLTVDLEDIYLSTNQGDVVRPLFLEAALQSAAVFLTGGERLCGEGEKSEVLKRTLLRALREMSWITFISAESLWLPADTDKGFQWHPYEFKRLSYPERKKAWSAELKGSSIAEADIGDLSGRFNFTVKEIRDIVLYAGQSLNGNGPTIRDIYNACRIRSNQRMSIYARKVTPHYIWKDIVLPEDRLRQLKEICSYIRHKHVVYFAWGFDKKLALGRGLNVLFSGPSGTGKTMAADIIAHEFNLDMYKIDLSSIVSKYIGETEKNLERIFRETSSGNVILFFDEADALFGKRSEVRDAHDRYANIEINYLLQRMEEHEGIVILATNLSQNIDDAFLRRMQFIVEFPFPDAECRRRIWEVVFPPEAPLGDDVALAVLGNEVKLAGGNIKNIALAAAFYAAEDGEIIRIHHLVRAIQYEHQKLGRTWVRRDCSGHDS